MNHLGEGLIVLGLGSSLGLALAYCQQQFKWNPEYVQFVLITLGLAISAWAYVVYAKVIKEFHQSLDDWD
jgi:uncharacterized integral membrane protein